MSLKSASIIIPTFNRAHLLPKAIDSALNQTYNCEVIVCDHGSNDNTPQVAAQYKNQITYIRKEVDNGPIVCWRDGLENSTGEIIHFNFDDDWMEPEYMERTIELLEEDVAFVYSRAFIHHEKGKQYISDIHPGRINPIDDIVKYLLQIPLTISPSSAIFRREDALKNLLSEIPGTSGKYGKNSGVGEDVLLFLLTALDYEKYAHVNLPLANFLAHSNSITIDSIITGQKDELIEAYKNSKKYYLAQANNGGNIPSGLRKLMFKIGWYFRADNLFKSMMPLFTNGILQMKLFRKYSSGND